MRYIDDSNNKETLEVIVNKADETFLRQYLYNILYNNQLQALDFKLKVKNHISDSDMNRYYMCIDEIFDSYRGKNNRILISNYTSLLLHLLNFLSTSCEEMVLRKCYKEAFMTSSYIFNKVNFSDIYDEKGIRDYLNHECVSIWDKILNKCDDEIIEYLFQWIFDELDKSLPNHDIDDFFMNHFNNEIYLRRKLSFVSDKLLQESQNKWNKDLYMKKWSNKCIILLKQLDYSYHQIHEYLSDYWHYSFIRQQYITYCINHQLYSEAILVLEESLQLDTKKEDIIQYRSQLKNIYLQLDDKESYKKQLWFSVTVDDPGNFDDYVKLKSLYNDDEWKDIREDIFMILPDNYPFDVLYKEEKLYDRLLKIVMSKNDLTYLHKYEEDLKDKYPKQLLYAYQTILEERVKHTAYRETYRSWVSDLKRMKNIEGGEKIVQVIVDDWCFKYHNRRALMEELKRL